MTSSRALHAHEDPRPAGSEVEPAAGARPSREADISPWAARGQLVVGAVAFVALTVGIFWYQFQRIPAGEPGPRWAELRWAYLGLLLLCLPVETLACGARLWVLARVLEPGVGLWTCIKAEWANVAISTLTPSQSGGGPGQIYILSRGGASVGTALTMSLISFVGTMVGLSGMGLYALLVAGTASPGPLFRAAVWALTAISGAMIGAAIWPDPLCRLLALASQAVWRLSGRRSPLEAWRLPERVDRLTAHLAELVQGYARDVHRFLRAGKAAFAWTCLLSVAFLLARCLLPVLCARFLGVRTGTLVEIVEAQMALVFLVFFAPTPGGAGVAEGASLSIMAEIVPSGVAPYYTLLWRFTTVYLAAIAGLVALGRAALDDARRLTRHPAS